MFLDFQSQNFLYHLQDSDISDRLTTDMQYAKLSQHSITFIEDVRT